MMLPFKTIQDRVVLPTSGGRFSESLRANAKDWIRNVYRAIWDADDWVFKQALSQVTVTAGSQQVTGLPGNVGIVHELQNSDGAPLTFRDWRTFERLHYGLTGETRPYDYTIIGAGPSLEILVAPISSETASDYQLAHEYDAGFYPSTTLTDTQVTLPTGTLNVAATSEFPAAGTVVVAGRPVTYTGKTPTALTGCTGGTGTFVVGEPVVCLDPRAGDLSEDTDVPMLPDSEILIHAAIAVGQTSENDYSIYLTDDRVQQMLEQWRRRYTIQTRGETIQWGSQQHAASMDGWPWRP